MKKLRIFLVRQFALSYQIRIGKFKLSSLRSSRIIAPLFLITGIVLATDNNPDAIQWYDICLIGLTLLSLFFGFCYFEIWPVKFDELDDYQKCQYFFYDPTLLSNDQYDEVMKILDEHPNW